MKCFVLGIFGAIFAIALGAFVFIQYGDYQGLAETSGILIQLEPLKKEIESTAIKQKSFADIDKSVQKPTAHYSHVDTVDITNTGSIVARGGKDGQVVILTPSFVAEKIAWHCIGGPKKDMPQECK